MNLFIVMIRTIFFYFFILICFRIMGKREVGQLSISDLTISILIAELVAISIENKNESVFLTILPIVLLVILEIIFAYIELKSVKLKKIIDGNPSIIINKGKLNIKEMIKQRYSLEDLLLSLRSNSIKSLKEVDYAILETNGLLSVFKKSNDKELPLPLIIDGNIEYETLNNINKNKNWLMEELNNRNLKLENVFYAFYSKNTIYIIDK